MDNLSHQSPTSSHIPLKSYSTFPLLEWEKKIQQLEAQGIRPIKVEVDVEELLTWCSTQELSVTPETRTKFMMDILRDQVQKGIAKP